MSFKLVAAIFDQMRLEAVETALVNHGVKGFTVHSVRGRGAYFDAYNRDPLTTHIRLLTYTNEKNARAVAQVIMDAAHAGMDNEGLVRISAVDELFWIHTRQCCDENDFEFHEVSND
ncbi:MAG: P-II family nitrogen regulator [Pseudomonadales bacterium]|nr:P-II family nitrogen regulator [Halioglobus sp.]MCP5129949.1 P-II family nitrogen regulator [Pseudomonadales bacterium]